MHVSLAKFVSGDTSCRKWRSPCFDYKCCPWLRYNCPSCYFCHLLPLVKAKYGLYLMCSLLLTQNSWVVFIRDKMYMHLKLILKVTKTKSLEHIHTRSKFCQSCAEFAWYQRCLGKTVLLLSPHGLVVFYPHCSTNVRFLRMCFQELGKPANNGIRYKLQLLYQNGKSHIL